MAEHFFSDVYHFPLAVAISLAIAYFIGLAVYRLYLSPIAKFPGRRLAALTFWYESYFDIVLKGQYTREIGRMHEEYGPIVRINPYELHINDPDFYDAVYVGNASGRKIDKWDWSARFFTLSQSHLGTLGHDLHAARRAPLASHFSKKAVFQLESIISQYTDRLMSRFEEIRGTETPVNLFHAFAALTSDIISNYSVGDSTGFLELPKFADEWYSIMTEGGTKGALFKRFSWLSPLIMSIPENIMLKMSPQMSHMVTYRNLMKKQLAIVEQDTQNDSKPMTRTIFHNVFESNLPPSEKSVDRMAEEGLVIVAAGTVTTADTLAVICFHVLANPAILARLQEELSSLHTKPSQKQQEPTLSQLEQLPYLSALIKEGLRISYGIGQRLPRISPDTSLQFKQWTIPPGYPVSMSAQLIHDNPTIFPNPRQFNPDRWLLGGKGEGHPRLDRYLVSFSKGTRMCLGYNLAYAEMYVALAALFAPGRFALRLFETTARDVEPVADFMLPGFPEDSKGVRVLIE